MKRHEARIVTPDPWQKLGNMTDARIGLGRCGTSMPLNEVLAFKLAHARARDAVHLPVDSGRIIEQLQLAGSEVLQLSSSAANRDEYLTRPDKGRRLSEAARSVVTEKGTGADVCIVLGDGLSSPAVNESGVPLILGLREVMSKAGLSLAPVCLVENGRVAIGDEIGTLLGTKLVVTLIGERPGLSSPNSLGAYVTINPRPGTTDEARNCVSNIRPKGLSIDEGIQKIAYLVDEAFRMGITGVGLKDRMRKDYLPLQGMIDEGQ